MRAPAPRLNNAHWVAKQYKTPNNLNARIQLHQRFSTNPHRWSHWIFDLLRLKPGMSVLEIGGGPGLLWEENRHQLSAKVGVTFTDQSAGMVAKAFATLGDLAHFHFGIADAQALPFVGGTFDVVIANHMLYHVPDRHLAFREIVRVLKPQGRFFAATNDHTHMQELRDLSKTFLPTVEMLISHSERFPFDVATEELSQHFGQLQLHRYHNSLVVTDANALADYMLSGIVMDLPAIAQAPFRQWLQDRIQDKGAIPIRSASGLFEGATAS